MNKSKKELFLELAQPDKNGMSRWVSTIEFVGKYQGLQLGNGGSWCRNNSSLAKEFELEFDKGQTPGNSIDRIRLNGYNTKCVFNQSIRQDIKNYLGCYQYDPIQYRKTCNDRIFNEGYQIGYNQKTTL
ncbi:hypothetical protein KYTH79_11490 [Helicobacter pylori]